jgi:hypothetical protein
VLYAAMGTRNQAVRQFQMCREALQGELGLVPGESTLAIYEEILADRIPKRIDAPAGDREVVESHRVTTAGPTLGTPMTGRDSVLQHLRERLGRAGQAVATGLLIFRTAWVAAILVSVLVFLAGLFSGSDGGDSSQQTPEVAFAPPPAPVVGGEAQKKAQKTRNAGPQDDRSQRAKEQAPGDGHSSSGVPRGSAAQPGDAGGGTPVVTPQPAPRPKPTPSPRPKPTPPQPQVPVSSQPAAPEPVQTTEIVANNNTGPP